MKNEFWKKDDKEIFIILGKNGKKRKAKMLDMPESMTRRFQAKLGKTVNEMKNAFESVFVKKVFMYRRDDGQMGYCVLSNIRVK